MQIAIECDFKTSINIALKFLFLKNNMPEFDVHFLISFNPSQTFSHSLLTKRTFDYILTSGLLYFLSLLLCMFEIYSKSADRAAIANMISRQSHARKYTKQRIRRG